MAISVRLNKDEEAAIRDFAAMHNASLSDFIRDTLIEKIEDYIDLQAIEDYERRVAEGTVEYVTAEDMFKKMGLD